MVEAVRIELTSKSIATRLSPSAACDLKFAPQTPTDKVPWYYLDKIPPGPPRISPKVSR